jgi:hypothetical protein
LLTLPALPSATKFTFKIDSTALCKLEVMVKTYNCSMDELTDAQDTSSTADISMNNTNYSASIDTKGDSSKYIVYQIHVKFTKVPSMTQFGVYTSVDGNTTSLEVEKPAMLKDEKGLTTALYL